MRFLIPALIPWLIAVATPALAQPMSGTYTVGGTAPSFGTLQGAADALVARGVSGPVFIDIRPGIYSRDGGAATVLRLDDAIAGASPTRRVTFRPDSATGGVVSNVVLSANFNATSAPRELVTIRADYVTLRSLTLRDIDDHDTPVFAFVRAQEGFTSGDIDGLEVESCRFVGTPYAPDFGSDIGIQGNEHLASASFTRNRFERMCRGITNVNSGAGGSLTVSDNEFHAGYQNHLGIGGAIELACRDASVRGNLIDMAGGFGSAYGISVLFASTAVIERNLVANRVHPGGASDAFRGIQLRFGSNDSILVANNVIVGNPASQDTRCLLVATANTRVLYNTLVNAAGGGPGNVALEVTGGGCTVVDNIILDMSGACFVAFDQGTTGQAANLVSDYNVVFRPDANQGLVRREGTVFTSLAGWQATGFDAHSVSKAITFMDNFHLDDCQAQDPALNGTPIPGIPGDYDNQTRNGVVPMKGADETERASYDMFGAGFRAGLSGTPFSLATRDMDGDQDDDIAIPDYDNRRVLLFRNQGAGRSFINFGVIPTNTAPSAIVLFDWDRDGNEDLIVSGDTSAVEVFWGNGAGTFTGGYDIVGTLGRVRSIVAESRPSVSDGALLWLTEDNGLLPNRSYLGNILCLAGRNLCHDVTYASGQPDTIPAVLSALATPELAVSQWGPDFDLYEIVALGIGSAGLFTFTDLSFGLFGTPCSPGCEADRVEQQFGTAPYLGFGSNIASGDFDGDGDRDLITTSASENGLIFVHNLGESLGAPFTIPSTQTRAVASLDYEGDGDLDLVAANRPLEELGITVYLNDGAGNFIVRPNCFFPFTSGVPNGMIASDFDRDGRTDLAIASSFDSLFVIYNLGGDGGAVDVGDPAPAGATIGLAQNVPNPFGLSTRIAYALPAKAHVTLTIYSVLGQAIATLADEEQAPGGHSITWTGRTSHGGRVGPGVYFYRLEAKEPDGTIRLAGAKRMIVLR